LLWVLTSARATNADITGDWGTAQMSKFGGGTFKYISGWYDPSTLPNEVTGSYDGKPTNSQLVVSHGCRPFVEPGAWCSPGFWMNAQDAAWTLIGIDKTQQFTGTVNPVFNGKVYDPDPTLQTVLEGGGGTYKGNPVPGTDPRTIAPEGVPLNAFNATGAWLTDHIPGYQYDPASLDGPDSETCPIDHHGNFKTPTTP
jgi:hypothetical protein